MERPPLPAGSGGGAGGGGGGATGTGTGTSTAKPKGRRNNSNNKRRKENRVNKANGNGNNSNGPNSNNHKNSNNNRNNNGYGGNNNAPKGPPPAPVVKVTIRNIQNAEQYGTSEKVIDGLIRTLVERANEKMPVDQKVELVQSNLEEVIMLEQNVMQVKKDLEEKVKRELEEKARKELEEKAQKEKAANPDGDDGEQVPDEEEQQQDIPESPAPAEETTKEPIVEDTAVAAVIPAMQNIWLSDKSKSNSNSNTSSSPGPASTTGIAARILYICPPKKTRRRGEKPGCAYLLLTAPNIEAKTPVPAAIVPAAIVENGGAETVAPVTPVPTPPAAEIDYTQEVTKRRLQLQLAIESMTNYAVDNAKAKQDLACCVVEESIDSKTWKVNYRPYRSQGVAVEDTVDYKQFVERTEQEKEERSARPKPPPGGSIAASAALAATENGQPMAALVLHLRAMHDEQSKRNKAKRKGRDAGKKAAPKGKEQDGGGGAGSKQQQDAAKKSKGRKKKKAPTKKPAPPKVLKAASSGGSVAPSASASVWNKG
jgi:hypothetical protein